MEMRFLRRIKGKTRLYRIRNETYKEELKVVVIEQTIQQRTLGWFGPVIEMETKFFKRRKERKKTKGNKKEGVIFVIEISEEKWERVRNIFKDSGNIFGIKKTRNSTP